MNVVLFACVHNAGRSQMAAAWFNRLADPAKARAISAGTDPGSRVHPEVIDAMNEVGVDLSKAGTTRLTTEVAQQAQMLITMGCGDQCPVVPGVRRDDWPLEDPKGKPIALVCHAPGVLRHATKPDGTSLVAGLRVTGFTDSEEEAMGLTEVVPFLVEDELVAKGADFSKAGNFESYVVTDGLLITGQNPASSGPAAVELISLVEKKEV